MALVRARSAVLVARGLAVTGGALRSLCGVTGLRRHPLTGVNASACVTATAACAVHPRRGSAGHEGPLALRTGDVRCASSASGPTLASPASSTPAARSMSLRVRRNDVGYAQWDDYDVTLQGGADATDLRRVLMASRKMDIDPSLVMLRLVRKGDSGRTGLPTAAEEANAVVLKPFAPLDAAGVSDGAWVLLDLISTSE